MAFERLPLCVGELCATRFEGAVIDRPDHAAPDALAPPGVLAGVDERVAHRGELRQHRAARGVIVLGLATVEVDARDHEQLRSDGPARWRRGGIALAGPQGEDEGEREPKPDDDQPRAGTKHCLTFSARHRAMSR